MTKGVPMKRIPWDITEPGHCEVDLVHHSGASSADEYATTISFRDFYTLRLLPRRYDSLSCLYLPRK